MKIVSSILGITIIVVLAFLGINPTNIGMPGEVQMTIIAVFSTFIISILVWFWRHKAEDERDEQNKYIANRFSLFVAMLALVFFIIFDALQFRVNTEAIIILSVTGIGNIFARLILD